MTPEQEIALVTSLIGFGGVILGVVVTSFVNWRVKSKEARLRVLEKIFDKRLSAHEEVLEIARLLRTTVSTKVVDNDSNLITYPVVLLSIEAFNNFQGRFYELVNFNTHWLDINLFRELNYVQDYIGSVDVSLKDKNDNIYPKIAALLKSDFIKIASSLKSETIKFFNKDILEMKINTQQQHHKYKKNETMKRLKETSLFNNWEEISRISAK